MPRLRAGSCLLTVAFAGACSSTTENPGGSGGSGATTGGGAGGTGGAASVGGKGGTTAAGGAAGSGTGGTTAKGGAPGGGASGTGGADGGTAKCIADCTASIKTGMKCSTSWDQCLNDNQCTFEVGECVGAICFGTQACAPKDAQAIALWTCVTGSKGSFPQCPL